MQGGRRGRGHRAGSAQGELLPSSAKLRKHSRLMSLVRAAGAGCGRAPSYMEAGIKGPLGQSPALPQPSACPLSCHGLDNLGMVSSALDVTPATSITSGLFWSVWVESLLFYCVVLFLLSTKNERPVFPDPVGLGRLTDTGWVPSLSPLNPYPLVMPRLPDLTG